MHPKLNRAIKRGIVKSRVLPTMARFRAPLMVILRYHSVLEDPAEHADSIGSGTIHSRKAFAQQMEYISRTCHLVTMNQVQDFVLGACTLPRRSIAVTFDDGFADNLSVAAPILNRYGVPATVYVMTEYVSGIPWYCTLRFIFAKTKRSSFTNPFDGTSHNLDDPKDRHESFLACSRACAAMRGTEIGAAIASLQNELDSEYRPRDPVMLDWDGVREIQRQGHIIGSHTRTHPNMACIPEDEVEKQMRDSKAVLERETNSKIHHFSYPSPIMQPHWGKETIKASRAAGYEMSVTSTYGHVRPGDEPLAIKRLFAHPDFDDFVWAFENLLADRDTE